MNADRSVWLGLGVVAVAIVVAFEATRRPSQRLADGTVIVLDKVEVNGQLLELRLKPAREDVALRLVHAQDIRGHDLRSQLTRLEPGIWQSILAEPISPRSVPDGKISVTVAIEPVLRLDFTTRPRLLPW